jgi:hypothetical protein
MEVSTMARILALAVTLLVADLAVAQTAAQPTMAPVAAAPAPAPTAAAQPATVVAQPDPVTAQSVPTAQPVPTVAQPAPVVAPPAPPPPQKAASAAPAQPAGKRGSLYSWGSVGTTFAYGETYGSANFGVGYLMRYGITPNAELGYAFGSSPSIWTLRPGVTWFLPVPVLRPYAGAFYTRFFVGDDEPDRNGFGARLGISLGRLLSVGALYERALDCSENCDYWSPQISAGFSM